MNHIKFLYQSLRFYVLLILCILKRSVPPDVSLALFSNCSRHQGHLITFNIPRAAKREKGKKKNANKDKNKNCEASEG